MVVLDVLLALVVHALLLASRNIDNLALRRREQMCISLQLQEDLLLKLLKFSRLQSYIAASTSFTCS